MMKKQVLFMGFTFVVMMYISYKITDYQHRHTEMENTLDPFDMNKHIVPGMLHYLPRGIIVPNSDLEMKPLWSHGSKSKDSRKGRNLLAIPAGIKQKKTVNSIVTKFLAENFTIVLFHYDGSLDAWMHELEWSKKVIHIVAQNQTKWWFAKRFLHPDVVSIYEYIFLWDEDLGVENFHPGRYLQIVRSAGLEISQPALDPNSTIIHHRITIRARTKAFHTRVYELRGRTKCDEGSEGPPCTGFVEGMAPVFSRSAWYCTWHLIQNDFVHGWGVDMKLGYCAQGDRSKKVGVVDSEFVVHQGIQTLGAAKKAFIKAAKKKRGSKVDVRMEIRRQSTWELRRFKERWKRAAQEDKLWTDPFQRGEYRKQRRN